jgi:hypothetical protein
MSRRSLALMAAAAGLSACALVSPASAGCGGWGCQPACEAPARFGPPLVYEPAVPCAVRFYPLQPVYRVEEGPIYNVVVAPYEPPRLRFAYGPPRFYRDCGCYR